MGLALAAWACGVMFAYYLLVGVFSVDNPRMSHAEDVMLSRLMPLAALAFPAAGAALGALRRRLTVASGLLVGGVGGSAAYAFGRYWLSVMTPLLEFSSGRELPRGSDLMHGVLLAALITACGAAGARIGAANARLAAAPPPPGR